MAVQFNEATRNARLDVIESTNGSSCSLEIRSGAVPAGCASPGGGVVLATIDLPSDWLAAAAGGTKSINGTWQDLSCDAAGTATYFRVYNSQSVKDATTCFMQGTVTSPGGGGDMEVSAVVFSLGATFTITTFTLTEGNA